MPRTLDLTALRSFTAVADAGGVTRAAGMLNLTQSAVSMQIKRLEESLGLGLFSRAARQMALTAEGEQLLGFARRMLALNDEALSRLTTASYEGELRLGVPHDIVYPAIPGILKRLAAQYPRMRINLVSSFTVLLRAAFDRGELDVMVTTEDRPGPHGMELARRDLVWVGAQDGQSWQKLPLRLGFKETCFFRAVAQSALTAAQIPWEMAIEAESQQVIEATVAADLAVTARLEDALPPGLSVIEPDGHLPDLGDLGICLYAAPTLTGEAGDSLLQELRLAYGK
jgi:DNA-binding transcriptional LysR family regulator